MVGQENAGNSGESSSDGDARWSHIICGRLVQRETGLTLKLIVDRLRRGWSMREVVDTPSGVPRPLRESQTVIEDPEYRFCFFKRTQVVANKSKRGHRQHKCHDCNKSFRVPISDHVTESHQIASDVKRGNVNAPDHAGIRGATGAKIGGSSWAWTL